MISHINRINAVGKYLVLAVLMLNLVSVAFASENISNALMSLCGMAKTFLGIGALLMIILAGAVYAVGQVMGAETRARASVWATAMLTGAVIGALIYLIAPIIIDALFAGTSMEGSLTCGTA